LPVEIAQEEMPLRTRYPASARNLEFIYR
jgi:hypothetical protein